MGDDFQVVDTGMIDTDITFNPRTQEWYFVMDGTTYRSISRPVLEHEKQKALADRDAALMHRAAKEGWDLVTSDWGRKEPDHEARRQLEIQQQREIQDERDRQRRNLIPDDPAALLRARELDEEWLERERAKKPDKGGSNLLDTIRRQNWEALVQAYHDGRHAGYEPEEIGDILYVMLQQQLGEQGSD